MKYFLLLTVVTVTVTSDLSIDFLSLERPSKICWLRASGVKPAAWISPKSCSVILPSGRTSTALLTSGSRQTWMASTSSGPITKLLGSSAGPVGAATAASGAAGFAPFFSFFAAAERSDRLKTHRRITRMGGQLQLIASIVQQIRPL